MDIFPLTNITTSPKGACVIPEQVGTVEDMPASPAYIRVLMEERARKEREDMRPRISLPVVSDDQPPQQPALLAGIVREASPSRSTPVPDASSIAVVDKGRVALRDAARIFGWNASTPLAFSSTDADITVTACAADDSDGTVMDKQQRCVVPLQARRRKKMENDESVLVITSRTPVQHVRIIPMSDVYSALDTKENTL